MTCIIALKDKNGDVYMGGDRAVSIGHHHLVQAQSKVYKRGNALIGNAGDSLSIALVELALVFPETSKDIFTDLRLDILPAVRSTLEEKEVEKYEVETLVAWQGKIIYITNLLDVMIIDGEAYAIGAFESAHAVALAASGNPKTRLTKALTEVARVMPTAVSGPFDIIKA